jgi:hypothetical protein
VLKPRNTRAFEPEDPSHTQQQLERKKLCKNVLQQPRHTDPSNAAHKPNDPVHISPMTKVDMVNTLVIHTPVEAKVISRVSNTREKEGVVIRNLHRLPLDSFLCSNHSIY